MTYYSAKSNTPFYAGGNWTDVNNELNSMSSGLAHTSMDTSELRQRVQGLEFLLWWIMRGGIDNLENEVLAKEMNRIERENWQVAIVLKSMSEKKPVGE